MSILQLEAGEAMLPSAEVGAEFSSLLRSERRGYRRPEWHRRGLLRKRRRRLVMVVTVVLAGVPAAVAGLPPIEHVEGELQLFGGNTDSGRLGLYHDGRWGAVCSDAWGLAEASVACRMLGFERSFQAMSMPAPASTPVWLSSVSCAGDESSLLDCTADRQAGDCTAADGVGVSCLAAGISGPNTPDVDGMINTSLFQLRQDAAAGKGAVGGLPPSSDGTRTCEVRDGVPLPFASAGSSYVYAEQLAPFFAEQHEVLHRHLCHAQYGDTLQSELLEWTRMGLLVNSFGIDPSALLGDGAVPHWAPGVPTRTSSPPAARERTADAMQKLRRAYLDGDGLQGLHWQIDRRGAPRSAELSAPADVRTRQLLDTLHHEGFVALSADYLDINLAHLQDQARTLLAAGTNRSMVSVTNLGAVRSARGRLSALEPMLRSKRISAIVRRLTQTHPHPLAFSIDKCHMKAAPVYHVSPRPP